MTITDQIVQELTEVPEPIQMEVLKYLRYLKDTHTQEELEDAEDLADAQAALQEIEAEGTVPWEQVKAELGVK
jgi:hypothetical protein